LPYDRANTTMKAFDMCLRCREEYDDPRDRRYHAQPNACSQCGPQLALSSRRGSELTTGEDALARAEEAIRDGRIVALKGLGGFQLVVDAGNNHAVARLRNRKHRDEKPFAVMAPSLEWVCAHCELSRDEERLLCSSARPITLLRRRDDGAVAEEVAPGNPFLGVMLPYTPLHHLVLADLDFPVVATSGNVAEEPIYIHEHDALERLGEIADVFLLHDRPIARHADDSVARVVAGRELLLRRARGYAPLPVNLATTGGAAPMLAVGAHQKNTVAVAVGGRAVLSQHIGDLSTLAAHDAFERCVTDLQILYDLRAEHIACDAHPDYLSTRYAVSWNGGRTAVQHHHAHVAACAADNGLEGGVLGVAWDGSGYGDDGTAWGGEFLLTDGANPARFERVAHLRPFRLPGGDKAVREPRRCAAGLLFEMEGERAFEHDFSFDAEERRVIPGMLRGAVNSPFTSSAGRLFDAVASHVGLRNVASFEGQAAMELEFAAHRAASEEVYPFELSTRTERPWVIDWAPMIRAIFDALEDGHEVPTISATFHNTLAEMIVAVGLAAGRERVLLSGGCFQNAYLTERAVTRLREEGLRPYWHQRVPPNDGGIALGQLAVAVATNKE
jgi:hydrogenase maturation protein HypF